MKHFVIVIFTALFCSCNSNEVKQADPPATTAQGEKLFKDNCYQCHRPGMESLGPNLVDVKERWKDAGLLYDFVRNPQQVIATNAYARELQKKYNGQIMLPFPQLTDAEIDAILKYCDETGK